MGAIMNKSILLPALVASIAANSFGEVINFARNYSFTGGSGQVNYTYNQADR